MNTPPKVKRYTYTKNSFQTLGGSYASGLFDPKYSLALAAIVSGFPHLEGMMGHLLAVLLGLDDTEIDTAGYVLRAIKSPSGRTDIMKDLLELSPRNVGLGPEYDEILKEFRAVSRLRNEYVHGLWFTHNEGTEILLAIRDEHGWGLLAAAPVKIEDMELVSVRIWNLYFKVFKTTLPEFQKRRPAPESHLPSEVPKPLP